LQTDAMFTFSLYDMLRFVLYESTKNHSNDAKRCSQKTSFHPSWHAKKEQCYS